MGLIEPHYPNTGKGRQPLGLEKMLRIWAGGGFIGQWRRVIRASALHVVAVPLMNDIGEAKTPFALLVDSTGQPRMSLRAWEVRNNPLEVQEAIISVARTLLNGGDIP